MLLFFLVPLVIIVVCLIRAYAEIDDDFLLEWSDAHGLVLTPVNRPMVRWYLRNARVLRTIGALAGLFLPPFVWVAVAGPGARQPLSEWVWIFAGYLCGALYAEVALTRPSGDRQSASLVPRRLPDYLPMRLPWAQRTVGVVSAVAGLAVLVVPYRSEGAGAPDRVVVAALGVGAGVIALGLERVQRWVVARPQPLAHPDLVLADDAIRSQSVHSLAGSGLAVQLLLFSTVAWALSTSDVQVLRWTMWVLAVAAILGAIHSCLYYGHRAWRVRRSAAESAHR